jgi:hypothetical protein
MVLYPQLHRLAELRDRGCWTFMPIRFEGELTLLTGARGWPDGWSDAIAIRDLGDAKAFRCDPAGGIVWHLEGSMIYVVNGLLELPAPHEPLAPKLVIGTGPSLWTPWQGEPRANDYDPT